MKHLVQIFSKLKRGVTVSHTNQAETYSRNYQIKSQMAELEARRLEQRQMNRCIY